jgi:LmbE family N-acetylglucosaminyl deacetylase
MNILVVAAHPDDEILGVGGTWHKREQGFGDKIQAVIFSKGRKDPLDQKFETQAITKFINETERHIKRFDPEVVYTHTRGDINKDHQVIHDAVKVACRPTRSNVKAVYGFNSTLSPFDVFRPNHFVNLTKIDMDWKVKVMKEKYGKEMDLPYRSEEGIFAQAEFYGSQIGQKYAEAFETIMKIE